MGSNRQGGSDWRCGQSEFDQQGGSDKGMRNFGSDQHGGSGQLNNTRYQPGADEQGGVATIVLLAITLDLTGTRGSGHQSATCYYPGSDSLLP